MVFFLMNTKILIGQLHPHIWLGIKTWPETKAYHVPIHRLKKWMLDDIDKAGFAPAAQSIRRILIQKTFQNG